jgi:beta-galactosidase
VIESFVKNGGTFITTYLAGTVDEEGLCHLGGRPGGLRKVLGIWAEECDALLDGDDQCVSGLKGNGMGLTGPYAARHYADIIHLEGAKALARYGKDWYKGSPAVTVNAFGKGHAYCIASRNSREFLSDFYGAVIKKSGLQPVFSGKLPDGIEVCERRDDKSRFLFFINYRNTPRSVALGKLRAAHLDSGKKAGLRLKLAPYGAAVLRLE